MTRADFKKNGRLGCPDCYAAFAEELASLLKAVHRSEQHTGKIPAREGDWVRLDARVVALQKELDQAVASEQYEKAAELRDEIHQLRDREQSEKQDPA
jgi:protein arginine kinase activator